MLIVIPKLTAEPSIYGIYTICVSLSVYLSYADIGFLSAGQKYAAEYYAKDDTVSEIKVIGFVHFILFLFISVFAIVSLIISLRPTILFNYFTQKDYIIASRILLVLSVSSFVVLFQRFAQSVFIIRIEDYVYQRIEVIFNIIKIISVFYFFRSGHYDIISYYICFQLVSLVSCIVCILIIKKRYNYDMKLVLYNFRFSRIIYFRVQKLAFSTLFVTIMWILYYELDTIMIGKLYGAKAIATYAIGLSILSFTRSLYGTLFGPFLARINHFAGRNEFDQLDTFLFDIIRVTFPVSIIPAITLIIMMPELIVAWVGLNYIDSIIIAQFLISLVLFYCFINPLNYLIIAKEKVKVIYTTSFSLAFIFLVIFFLLKNQYGIVAMAIAKSVSIVFYVAILLLISSKFVKHSLIKLIINLLVRILIPVAVLLIILYLLRPIWKEGNVKSIFGVIRIGVTGGIASVVAISGFYILDGRSRKLLKSVFINVFPYFKKGSTFS
jgi:O-antigen/teichoic acid export membrane protein